VQEKYLKCSKITNFHVARGKGGRVNLNFSQGRKERVVQYRIDYNPDKGKIAMAQNGYFSHNPRKQEIEWT
jgi:hypothetical protein